LIEIVNLTKRFGNKLAVDNVSFTVDKGEIVGFLGPNGAGKTTTMNIITGYLSSTSGSCRVENFDVLKNPEQVKQKIGYLPENPPLYLDMTVFDYLNFVYDLKKIKNDRQSHLKDIMETVKISNVSHRLIKNLSKGYKQRVGLAQALLGNPEILILDEPTAGLDPKQINEIRNVIKELGKERTIILSSHILPEVSAICERVVIINNGKIVAEDTPENLSKSMTDSTSIKVRIEGEQQEVLDLLNSFEEIAKIDSSYYEDNIFDYFIETRDETDVRRKLFYALAQNKMPILMLGAHGLSLEDVFLKLTTVEQIQQPDTTENNSENSDESEQAQADI
jgi:ABC-2 type transport system ATP-binding protein